MATSSKLTPAEDLDAKFSALGNRFDKFYTQIPVSAKNSIQKSISDWQDWFNGEDVYGRWPTAPLKKWTDVYNLSYKLLEATINQRNLKEKEPVVYETTKKITLETPTLVFGSAPKHKIILLILGSAALGGIIYSYSKHA